MISPTPLIIKFSRANFWEEFGAIPTEHQLDEYMEAGEKTCFCGGEDCIQRITGSHGTMSIDLCAMLTHSAINYSRNDYIF